MKKFLGLFLLLAIVPLVSAANLTGDAQFFYTFDTANVSGSTQVDWSSNARACLNNGTIQSLNALQDQSWNSTTGAQGCINTTSNLASGTVKALSFWVRLGNGANANSTSALNVLYSGASNRGDIGFGSRAGGFANEVVYYYSFDGASADAGFYWNSAQVSNIADNTWHHVVITNDSGAGDLRLYLNGVDEGNASAVGARNFYNFTTNIGVGGRNGLAMSRNSTMFDFFGAWNTSLNSTDVATLYNAGLGYNPFTATSSSTTDSLAITAYDSRDGTQQTDFYANVSYNGFTELNLHTTNGTIYLNPLTDQSGNNKTLSGNATYNNNEQLYTFNNQSQNILNVTLSQTKIPIGNYSISAWFTPQQTAQSSASSVINLMTAEDNPALNLEYNTATTSRCTGSFYNSTSANVGMNTATFNPTGGNLYHVICALSYNGTTAEITMYVNGVFVNSTNRDFLGFEKNFTEIRIAAQKRVFARYFNGTIDNVRYFTKTINSTEALQLYNNETISEGLGAWYPFVNVTQNGSLISANVSNPTHFQNQSVIVNTSTSPYTTYLVPWANITCYNRYNSSLINACTAQVGGTNYTTATGSVLVQSPANNTNYDAILYSPSYYDETYYNANGAQTFNATLFQAQVNYQALEIITGNNITSFTATVGNGTANNTNTTPVTYLNSGFYSATFNKTSWFNSTTNFTIGNLSNTTQNFTVYQTLLNITAVNIINGASVTSFNITLNSSNYSYNTTATTTNGSILIPWVSSDTVSVYFYSSGYATTNHNLTVNTTGIQNFTLSVYSAESILFRFFDEQNGTIMNFTTVTTYITGPLASYNFTTTNGTYYIDLLTPQNYVITYSAPDYSQREYFYTVTEDSTTNLDLFLLREIEDDLLLVNVLDTASNRVENATVKMQKKNLTGTNYYIVEECMTNKLGQCLLHPELFNTTYQFIIEYENLTRLNSGDTKLVNTELTFIINIEATPLTTFTELNSIQYNLSNTSSTITYTWNDVYGNTQQACLVLKHRIGANVYEDNTTCASAATGSIVTSYNNTLYHEWIAEAYIIDSEGQNYFLDTLSIVTSEFKDQFNKQGLYLFGFGLICTMVFSAMYSPVLPVVVFAFGVYSMNALGFISIGTGGVTAVIVIAVIMVYLLRKT